MSYKLIENEKNLNLMFQALKSGKKKKIFYKISREHTRHLPINRPPPSDECALN